MNNAEKVRELAVSGSRSLLDLSPQARHAMAPLTGSPLKRHRLR